MTDFRAPERQPAKEPGPQPDPMLQTGRRRTGSLWLFAFLILAVIAGTLYGINNQESQTATNEPAATQAEGPNAAPTSAVSGGRTTGSAPPEQQAEGQTGQGTGAEQNPAAGTQGNQNQPAGQSGQQAPKQ